MTSLLALLPSTMAIVLAMTTRQVIPSLVLGLMVGAYSVARTPLGGVSRTIDYAVGAAANPENLRIILFIYVFSGLVGMMQISGGVKGFSSWLGRRLRGQRPALLALWGTAALTFMDCEFRIMAVGGLSKSLSERLKIAKQRVAFIVDSSTVPLIVLIPVATTYVGYMTSVVTRGLRSAGLAGDPYSFFVRSIPFNFFALSIVAIGLVSVIADKYYGLIGSRETLKVVDQPPEHEENIEKEMERVKGHPYKLVVPLLFLVALTFGLLWWNGHGKAPSFWGALAAADAPGAMLQALLISTIFATLFYFLTGTSLSELMFHFVEGANEVMMAVILLVLVWGIATVSEDLGFSRVVSASLARFIPAWVVPAGVFILGCLVSFFIGSSWGTWGLLMPFACVLAVTSGSHVAMTIAAVFAGGTFGDYTSPLSETTVTTAAVMNLPVVEYARGKMTYSAVAVGSAIALFLAFGRLLTG